MTITLRPSKVVTALLLGLAAPVASQQELLDVDEDARPIFGFSLGLESVPTAIDPTCGAPVGHRTGGVLGGHLTVPLGGIAVQGGANLHPRAEILCSLGSLPTRGVVTSRHVDIESGDFVTLEARLRLPGSGRSWWSASLGGGWAASGKALPYVAGSIGARVPGSLPVGLDLELRAYRATSVFRTAEYDQGELVSVLAEAASIDWEHSIAVRFVLEVPTRR